ncbi:MAG: DUF4143 domain-containing protein [Blastocatellia bacterium]
MASTPASSAPIAAGIRLRPDDLGQLWEHYVLNELTAQLQTAGGRYWRDKQGHEVDLIWAPRGKSPTAIECKWSARGFNPANLLTLRPRLSQSNLAGADPRRPACLHPKLQRRRSTIRRPRPSRRTHHQQVSQ